MQDSLTAPIAQRVLPPADTHVARIYSIVDLGTQNEIYKGKPKVVHKIMFRFELPEARHIWDEAEGERPHTMVKEFSLSMGSEASLRKAVEAIRGKFASDEEAAKFEILSLVGQACLLQIEHVTKPTGTSAKIIAITKLPSSTKAPEQFNTSFIYLISHHTQQSTKSAAEAAFAAFPEFMRNKIAASPEYKRAQNTPF